MALPVFVIHLMPFINHYYTKLQDKKDALTRHIVWFNTTQNVSTFVMGLAASMILNPSLVVGSSHCIFSTYDNALTITS